MNNIKNFETKLCGFYNCLKQWQHRKSTLLSKVTAIKPAALPNLVLSLFSQTQPEIMDTVRKPIYTFVWNGKSDTIKKDY